MTYDAFETSKAAGDPIELYRFDFNGALDLRTSSQQDVSVLAPDPFEGLYVATVGLSRTRVKQTAKRAQSNGVEITMPATDDIVTRFISIPPGLALEVVIVRFHRSDPDAETAVYWTGQARTVRFTKDGREATVVFQQITLTGRRQTPRFVFSSMCNHILYDSRCKIDKDDPAFRKDLPVAGQNGTVYTLTGAGAFGADFFLSGFLEFNGDFRQVVAQSGDDLTVALPFSESPVGEVIPARAGCRLRVAEDCDTKFSNVDNFGGFPFVPAKNPFEGLD